jgi:hypothetical protein
MIFVYCIFDFTKVEPIFLIHVLNVYRQNINQIINYLNFSSLFLGNQNKKLHLSFQITLNNLLFGERFAFKFSVKEEKNKLRKSNINLLEKRQKFKFVWKQCYKKKFNLKLNKP